MTSAPLANVRVLDVSRFVSGPLCTFFLASLGAEVLAVEAPLGSPSRRLPPFAGPEGGLTAEYRDGVLAVPFLKRSRGKRSVALDITHPDGQRVLRTIAGQCDVFVDNSQPDTMERFGLGYEAFAGLHPGLVYCAISGEGRAHPGRPTMDNVVQARSGLMAKTGAADGPPLRTGITIADHTTATFAALGILAALRQREAGGRGQLVDVAMLDVLTALVWDEPVDHYAASGIPVRTGNADPRGAPINAYRCADGWVAVTCTNDAQFERLCSLLARDDLQARFANQRVRAERAREIDAAIEGWTSSRPALAVEAALTGIGLPCGRVREPIEAVNDTGMRARGLLEPLRHPDAPIDRPSGLLGARLPISFDGRVDLPPSEPLGASTESVLRELGGCRHAEIAVLREAGVIR